MIRIHGQARNVISFAGVGCSARSHWPSDHANQCLHANHCVIEMTSLPRIWLSRKFFSFYSRSTLGFWVLCLGKRERDFSEMVQQWLGFGAVADMAFKAWLLFCCRPELNFNDKHLGVLEMLWVYCHKIFWGELYEGWNDLLLLSFY